MREIEFCFWLEKEKKMCSWELMKRECNRLSILEMEGFIPLQFIGKLDKTGKKIHEGDIVKRNAIIAVIKYENSAFLMHDISSNRFGIPNNDVEIIDNRFENPELMGEMK